MIITEIKGNIYVSTMDTPYEKSLRCVNAAEQNLILSTSLPEKLKAEGYVATIAAAYNLPTSLNPEKIYGTQDLHLNLQQLKGLHSTIQSFLENLDYSEYKTVESLDTSKLSTDHEMISGDIDDAQYIVSVGKNLESDLVRLFGSFFGKKYGASKKRKKIRVSGIGVDLKTHLFCANKASPDSIVCLGGSMMIPGDFLAQGYVAIVCASIYDGNAKSRSTQDLYVTLRQLQQLDASIKLMLDKN